MKRRDALVKELESGGCLPARELASRLGVSRSTVVRDVARLREAGVPIRLDRISRAEVTEERFPEPGRDHLADLAEAAGG
ncbi:helix-turn-helix domain-containing protein [Microbispora sp. NBC_01189]|uniref:helix-turn-helix domain-containing protein n=1 Tax=Microbispora sp. NBC_01189 TaxID=2903583 RepID=UPI002E1556F1|nr:helix-turn-helix domain-containing protein [Microbispora sp. NBC_01189]